MKKFILLLSVLICSCSEYEVPSTFDMQVTVKYPAEFSQGSEVAGAEVKVTNVQTGRVYLVVTGSDGKARFHLRGGNYNIVVSIITSDNIAVNSSDVYTPCLHIYSIPQV